MKCDELQYERLGDANKTYTASTLVIRKQFVDAAITELKARIHELESMPHTDNSAVIERISNENERMKSRIAELEEERRWRKCSEELPEDGAEVLATDGDGIWLCYKTTMSDGSPWFQPDGLPQIEGVTHWMPLPSAPKEGK